MAAPPRGVLAAALGCWLAFVGPHAEALIIPQELPTILSVIYSNIPPILKGTDSRFGLGFRFGPHADFQVQLELGPQMYTQRLGPEEEAKRRRQAARPPPPLRLRLPPTPISAAPAPAPDTLGSRWLTAWRSGLVNPSQNIVNTELPIIVQDDEELPEQNDVAAHLTSLYNSTDSSNSTSSST